MEIPPVRWIGFQYYRTSQAEKIIETKKSENCSGNDTRFKINLNFLAGLWVKRERTAKAAKYAKKTIKKNKSFVSLFSLQLKFLALFAPGENKLKSQATPVLE